MQKPKPGSQAELVEKWQKVPEGTEVEYRETTFSEWLPTKTDSQPFLLGGNTACIMLDGVSGAFSLEFVRHKAK